jgi:hypothetical protein
LKTDSLRNASPPALRQNQQTKRITGYIRDPHGPNLSRPERPGGENDEKVDQPSTASVEDGQSIRVASLPSGSTAIPPSSGMLPPSRRERRRRGWGWFCRVEGHFRGVP